MPAAPLDPRAWRDPWLPRAFVVAWLVALALVWGTRLGPLGGLAAHLTGAPPVGVGLKLLVSLYAAALPASVALYSARFDRSPWLGLLAFPLVWSDALVAGHLTFCLGLPALLVALAALDAVVEKRTPARVATLLVAGTLAAAALRELPWRGPAAPLGESLGELYRRVLVGWWPGTVDELCLLALVTTWLALAATAPAADEPPPPITPRTFAPELFFVVAALAYLMMPAHLAAPAQGPTDPSRLALAAALFGTTLIRGRVDGARRWLMLPALAVAVAFPLLVLSHFRGTP